jgi:hypothetical protein
MQTLAVRALAILFRCGASQSLEGLTLASFSSFHS